MTREEAIKILKSKMDGSVDTSYEWAEAVRMAIEALKAPTGFISKRDAIEIIKNRIEKSEVGESVDHDQVIADIALFPSAEPPYQYSEAYVKQLRGERDILEEMVKNMAYRPTGWIPVIWHEITDEERNREGYPKDWVVHLDCEMPSDEQKILVTTRWGTVEADVCYEDGEFSLDSGYDWIDDVLAWMPLPEPYKGGESE